LGTANFVVARSLKAPQQLNFVRQEPRQLCTQSRSDSQGLGVALVLDVLSRGGRVIAVDREVVSLNQQFPNLSVSQRKRIKISQRDLTDAKSCEALIQDASRKFGEILCLICATGDLKVHREIVTSVECRKRFESNFFVPFQMVERLLEFRASNGNKENAVVVFVSSLTVGLNPFEVFDYALAKPSLESTVAIFRQYCSDEAVKLMIIRPGFLETNMAQAFRFRPFLLSTQRAASGTRILVRVHDRRESSAQRTPRKIKSGTAGQKRLMRLNEYRADFPRPQKSDEHHNAPSECEFPAFGR
jgi:NAD(P)-dependent dehydrogenase (short-subunit alcohol dehydrogenase family)